MQFAFSRGFTEENIIIFGWSIGGFPATWATANYPNIRGLILDASFDHVVSLATATMPGFAEKIVKIAIHEYFNLDVSTQVYIKIFASNLIGFLFSSTSTKEQFGSFAVSMTRLSLLIMGQMSRADDVKIEETTCWQDSCKDAIQM